MYYGNFLVGKHPALFNVAGKAVGKANARAGTSFSQAEANNA
jgi:hypothetical protein